MTDDSTIRWSLSATADMPERFFDRFMFNLHPDGATRRR